MSKEIRIEFRIYHPGDDDHSICAFCDVHNIKEIMAHPEIQERYVDTMWKSLVRCTQSNDFDGWLQNPRITEGWGNV